MPKSINYHSSKGPLIPFLAIVMEKDFIDRLRLHAHAKTDVIDPTADCSDDGKERTPRGLGEFPAGGKSAEEIVAEDEFKANVLELVRDNEELREVVEAVFELELLKRDEIAEFLNIKATDVTNRKKLLQRRLAKLRCTAGRA